MATGGLTPIRGNDAYIGWIKQAAWGTPLAPTFFWRWLDGSEWNPEMKLTSEREGDTSPFISIAWKTHQMGMVKVVEYARPISAGCALQALLGSGSDTYTAPTISTTLSSAVLAGATSLSTVATLGTVGTLAVAVEGGYSSTTGEIVTVDLTTHTGAGPFTYTLANAATFRLGHSNSGTVVSQASHALTRQTGPYDPYTLEWAYGHAGGTPSSAWRLQDAVCTELKISGQANHPIRFEHTWYGALSKLQAALSSPVYEGAGVIGTPSAPFRFDQGGSSWQIDGAGTGNAATIAKYDVTIKNSTDVQEFVTETLTPAYFQPGNCDISANLDVVFQNFAQYYETYFGSTAPASGSSDSAIVGVGSFQVTHTLDAINSLLLNLKNAAYQTAKITPKLDGKAVHQPIQLIGQRSASVSNPFAATLTNAQNSQY